MKIVLDTHRGIPWDEEEILKRILNVDRLPRLIILEGIEETE